jgi:hypothetical protein
VAPNEAALGDQANFMDAKVLEIGRTPVLVRGVILAFAPAWIWGIVFASLIVDAINPESSRVSDQAWLGVLAVLVLLISLVAIWSSFRFDVRQPRQTPVRFNRVTKKVYWNCHQRTWNPFGKWRQVIKTWNWDTVQAKIHKNAGFNGKIYVVRYRLELETVEPGTSNVLDREYLSSPVMTTIELERTWGYIRTYMERGPSAVRSEATPDRSVHYIRSLFTYYEWALPGHWGAQARKDMFGQGVLAGLFSLFVVGITIVGAPIFLYLGVTNYIALKWAPELRWPPEVDAESRSIDSNSLNEVLRAQLAQQTFTPLLASKVAALLTAITAAWLVYAMWLRGFIAQ